jgi:sugar-specific transcriptional regulator TrmB
MSSQTQLAIEHLVALGFTEIEAAAYAFLVRESPATGYRVAQGIGRTSANTYKALESLESRGAVMAEDGETRNYRALPPEELLRGLEREFTRHREGVNDDRVYQLRTPSQVYERCRSTIASARHVLLLDIFSEPLAGLRDAIEQAAARGVRVAMLVYEPTEFTGVDVVLNHQAGTVRERWSGQWVNLAADSAQQVHALISGDGAEVLHATWSASVFLAHLYQSGLLGELSASIVRNAIKANVPRKEILRRLRRLDQFEHTDTPGFSALTTTASVRAARPRSKKNRGSAQRDGS